MEMGPHGDAFQLSTRSLPQTSSSFNPEPFHHRQNVFHPRIQGGEAGRISNFLMDLHQKAEQDFSHAITKKCLRFHEDDTTIWPVCFQLFLDAMALPRATSSSSSLWIFGYGSLVWNPGFEYRSSQVGFITGYSRRFWQGNVNHRGTCEQPGRVATLVEESEAVTWGRAFQLKDESSISALDYLNCRETSLGGYITKIVNFQPKMAEKPETPEKKFEESENPTEDSVESQTSEPTCFPVLLYMATTDNPFYLGPAPIQEIASQIVNTRGTCGHNVEYVLRLAEFMKKNVPNVHDVHLFTLECHILEILKEKRVCVESVMGDFRPNVESPEVDGGDEAAARPNNFLFTLTLPIKKRCLSA